MDKNKALGRVSLICNWVERWLWRWEDQEFILSWKQIVAWNAAVRLESLLSLFERFSFKHFISFQSSKIGANAARWVSYTLGWFIKHPSMSTRFFFPWGEKPVGLTWRAGLRVVVSDAEFFGYLLIQHNTQTSPWIQVINAISGDPFKLPAAFLTGIFAISFPTETTPGKGHIISSSLLKTQMSAPVTERTLLENSAGGREGLVFSP